MKLSFWLQVVCILLELFLLALILKFDIVDFFKYEFLCLGLILLDFNKFETILPTLPVLRCRFTLFVLMVVDTNEANLINLVVVCFSSSCKIFPFK